MKDMTCRRRKAHNPLFRKRWFADDTTIIQCMNWYLYFKLSYRDLALMMGQLGLSVAPSTILRWVVRYSTEFAQSIAPGREAGRAVMALRRDIYSGRRQMDVSLPCRE